LAAVRISSAGITAPVTTAGGMVLSSSSFEREWRGRACRRAALV